MLIRLPRLALRLFSTEEERHGKLGPRESILLGRLMRSDTNGKNDNRVQAKGWKTASSGMTASCPGKRPVPHVAATEPFLLLLLLPPPLLC